MGQVVLRQTHILAPWPRPNAPGAPGFPPLGTLRWAVAPHPRMGDMVGPICWLESLHLSPWYHPGLMSIICRPSITCVSLQMNRHEHNSHELPVPSNVGDRRISWKKDPNRRGSIANTDMLAHGGSGTNCFCSLDKLDSHRSRLPCRLKPHGRPFPSDTLLNI